MDEHESLTGHEAEGIRIIGAVEAGPTPSSAAGPTRHSASAPQGASPWESSDDSDEWDDSWLAGDGDLELDAPASAPRPAPTVPKFDAGDDDDATGEHPNLWGSDAARPDVDDTGDTEASATQRRWSRPTEAVRVLDERGDQMDEHDDHDDHDDHAYGEDAYDDQKHDLGDEHDDENENDDDDDDDDDDEYGNRPERHGGDGSGPTSLRRPTLLIADVDHDPEMPSMSPVTKPRRRAGRGEGESTRRPSGPASTEPRRRSGAGPVEPAVAAGGNRIITGLALIVVAAFVIKFGKERGVVLLAVLAGVAALLELFTALRQRGFLPAIIHGLVATAMFPIAAYLRGTTGVVVVVLLSVLVFCLWYLVGPSRDRPVVNIAVSMLGLLYIGFMVSIVGLIVRGNPGTGPDGKRGVALFVGALIGAAVHDIAGLFVGKNLGRVPIAPEVSPNKTLEGLVGGIVFSIVATALFGFLVEPLKGETPSIVAFALIVGLLAPLGDLVESMMKRDLGIKDMGSILPGHGGVLDRIDALLFVMPGVYLLALAKGWVG